VHPLIKVVWHLLLFEVALDSLINDFAHNVLFFSQIVQNCLFALENLFRFGPWSYLRVEIWPKLVGSLWYLFSLKTSIFFRFPEIFDAFVLLILLLNKGKFSLLQLVDSLRVEAELLVDYFVLERVFVLITIDELLFEGIDNVPFLLMEWARQTVFLLRQPFRNFSVITVLVAFFFATAVMGLHELVVVQLFNFSVGQMIHAIKLRMLIMLDLIAIFLGNLLLDKDWVSGSLFVDFG